tara:strand:- start:945 stop:1571 length:627 start_codon:yes stop_codon:yes gene_type:complete
MRKIRTIRGLDEFGRVQLSAHFRMRDFLYSDISNFHSIPNIPGDPNLAINAGRALCEHLLEPLRKKFGEILIRSAFRSEAVNDFGNKNRLNCASNQRNYARHIWDRRDKDGNMGATACISIPWFSSRLSDDVDWRQLAWWIHDHLPYNEMVFFPRNAAFNLNWRENPQRRIDSYARPKGCLTKPGMSGRNNEHPERYPLISRGLITVT